MFNEFFINIGSKLAHAIPSTNTQNMFHNYLKNMSLSTFNFKLVTVYIVMLIIKDFYPKTSAGHDSISTVLL